ncbi:actin family [Lipomyces oligophaga]|uniref:actin family n=1 Tax=Lipomyces oligophaga TaxID=45792 RepID=UPI0034CF4D93
MPCTCFSTAAFTRADAYRSRSVLEQIDSLYKKTKSNREMDLPSVLLNQPIVLDNGTGEIKAGFAGAERPQVFFPSYVGRPKHARVMAGALEDDIFIGQQAQDHRGLLKLKYPLEHGVVNDWADMERIWSFVYSHGLKVLSEEHPVLLTEAPLNPRYNRQRAAEIFFETFNVPALFLSVQAVLALYASGRTTGVVLDAGDGVSHSVPVYEGFAIANAIRRIDVGGRDVTLELEVQLRKNTGAVLHTSAEREIVRTMKERMCYVALDIKKEERDARKLQRRQVSLSIANPGPTTTTAPTTAAIASTTSGQPDEFTLPDGHVLRLGIERFRAPEVLFDPSLLGLEYPGIPDMLSECIGKVDVDLRRPLYSNIVLSGGTTLMRGFGDRLLSEVRSRAPKDIKIRIFAPPERKYSTWIGGSILAGLSTFRKMWVGAEEWRENPDLVHIKCI